MSNLIKIEFPSAIEVVSARFDNALELADKDAMVYGGVIRDMLAGLPLEGDLDIVAAYDSYLITLENFRMSGKWVEEGNSFKAVMVKGFHKSKTFAGYKKNKNINKTATFKTFADTKVQLIQARSQYTKNLFETNLEVVKGVDIICCGLIMDINGNIFEVLENAHSDCLNRILRLNKSKHTLNIQILQERIAKLSKRGWESKINLERVKKMIHKIKTAEHKELKEKGGKFNFDASVYIACIPASGHFGSCVIIDEKITGRLVGISIRNIVHRAAKAAGIEYRTASEGLPKSHDAGEREFVVYVRTAADTKRLKLVLIDIINEKLLPDKKSFFTAGDEAARSISKITLPPLPKRKLTSYEAERSISMTLPPLPEERELISPFTVTQQADSSYIFSQQAESSENSVEETSALESIEVRRMAVPVEEIRRMAVPAEETSAWERQESNAEEINEMLPVDETELDPAEDARQAMKKTLETQPSITDVPLARYRPGRGRRAHRGRR